MSNTYNDIIRVLVVDDSAFMRKVILEILNSDESIKVIGTAQNGVEAVEKVRELKPDVITLDLEMPVMDGLTCLSKILQDQFIPIIILSSSAMDGNENTIRALEEGAIDFITKPYNIFDIKRDKKKFEIIEKVKIANTIKARIITDSARKKPVQNIIYKDSVLKNIVVIGISTGGPQSLKEVIPKISKNIPAAIVIIQHMPEGFTKRLAERLDSISNIIVKEAEDGDILKAGVAYVAPGDFQMLLEKLPDGNVKVKLTKDPPIGGLRPSANITMNSLAKTGLRNIIGVIMTGMGGDGSQGIVELKNNNGSYIIAQDENTSVIYGMPKVAVQTGVVDIVVPLEEIANEIMKSVRGA